MRNFTTGMMKFHTVIGLIYAFNIFNSRTVSMELQEKVLTYFQPSVV